MADVTRITLFLIGLLALIGLGHAMVSVELSISEPPEPGHAYHSGNNVTMICRIKGGKIGMVVYWHKMIVTESGDLRELVATNTDLAPEYSLPRFSYTHVMTGEVVLFILTVYGVNRKDSGHYTCSVPNSDDAFDSVRMEIYSPPVEVRFEGYENGDTIHFTEGESKPVTCVVQDVLPTPDITVSVGSVDYTQDFDTIGQLRVKCDGNAENKQDCPVHYTYDYTLTNGHLLPSYQADGARLTCSVLLPGSQLPPVSASLLIAFSYAPKILCESHQEAQLGGEYDITCIVQAAPRPTMANFAFTLGTREYKIYPENDSQGKFASFYKEIDSQQFEYTLRIYHVYEEMLTTYNVNVENAMGITTQTVQLSQDMSLPVLSSASAVTSYAASLFTAVLFSSLLRS